MKTLDIVFENGFLLCPNCGGDYLHQEEVTTYWRDEDDPTGLRTVSSFHRSFTDRSMEGNPSSRRQGLTIRFDCESCSATPVLSVVQHKGQTVLKWRTTNIDNK